MTSTTLFACSLISAIAAVVFHLLGLEQPVTGFLAIMFAIWACYAAIKETQK